MRSPDLPSLVYFELLTSDCQFTTRMFIFNTKENTVHYFLIINIFVYCPFIRFGNEASVTYSFLTLTLNINVSTNIIYHIS